MKVLENCYVICASTTWVGKTTASIAQYFLIHSLLGRRKSREKASHLGFDKAVFYVIERLDWVHLVKRLSGLKSQLKFKNVTYFFSKHYILLCNNHFLLHCVLYEIYFFSFETKTPRSLPKKLSLESSFFLWLSNSNKKLCSQLIGRT